MLASTMLPRLFGDGFHCSSPGLSPTSSARQLKILVRSSPS